MQAYFFTKTKFAELLGIRSFSQPEKLWLKIHTGSSRTVYSYWVEKALLFPNWSSFSRQLTIPYVSSFCRFSLNPEGGGGGERYGREVSVHYRPGRYGKERRVGAQGYPGRTGTAGSSCPRAPTGRPVRQGKQGGPVQEGSRSGWYGGEGWHLHHNQLITSQQTTSEADKAIFIQGFISIDVLKVETCPAFSKHTGYTPYD